MAVGISSRAAEPTDAAIPTEDALQALIDFLVFPLLPLRPNTTEPVDAHHAEAVAKQMHAVALLYNYYHRRQFPELEFLGFETFCKLSVIARPTLIIYMEFMRSNRPDWRNLSVTEKMVIEACNISTSLDASREAPNMESWPVSKIAVFLVDPAKEKCLLQFSTTTQGVWSLVEKDLETSFSNLVGEQWTSGSPGGTFKEIDDTLNQLALSAAMEATGIDQSKLSVLEHHISYSLSREKTTTLLYIMMYTEAAKEEFTEVPLKDVLNSLRDPIFKRVVSIEVTPAVEYYHLLPYVDILSGYLSRGIHHDCSLHVGKPDAASDETCLLEPAVTKLPMEGLDILNKSDWIDQTPSSLCNKMRESLTAPACRSSRISSPSAMKLDRLPIKGVQATSNNASPMGIPSKSKNIIKKTVTAGSSMGVLSKKGVIEKIVEDVNEKTLENTEGIYACTRDTNNRENNISQPHICSRDMITNQVGAIVGVKDKVTSEDRDRLTSEDHARLQLVTPPKKTDLLHASLRILHTKLDVLCQQQSLIQEEVARCEMNIQTVLNGGEENLRSNMELIIEASNFLCSNQMQASTSLSSVQWTPHHQIEQKRLSEAVLSLESPCQELNSICRANNWILPRYSVLPSFSNGMYQANVMVQGLDFKFTIDGEFKSNPSEARESAASRGLSKLRTTAEEAM